MVWVSRQTGQQIGAAVAGRRACLGQRLATHPAAPASRVNTSSVSPAHPKKHPTSWISRALSEMMQCSEPSNLGTKARAPVATVIGPGWAGGGEKSEGAS